MMKASSVDFGYNGSMERPPVDDETPEAKGIPCFRCGICCMKYSPRVTAVEAEHIAESLGVSLEDFLDRYVDDSWFEPGYYLLDTQDGACIFLVDTEDSRVKSCSIHSIRPQVCREWQPGFDRKECLEGLQKCWGLAVDSSGKLQGTEDKVQEFKSVIESRNDTLMP
jgi:Fe-S-cluster containining protein